MDSCEAPSRLAASLMGLRNGLRSPDHRRMQTRRRYQRGSVRARQRNGTSYWYAQWRENGRKRSKELGRCSALSRWEAQLLLADIVRPLNERQGLGQDPAVSVTLGDFIERLYLPIWGARWKVSTALTETDRIRHHIVGALGSQPLKFLTRADLQSVLDAKAHALSRSVVTQLRFRLRSIFAVALSEGVIDRDPTTALYTPRHCRPAKEKRVLAAEEFKRLLAALDVREQTILRLATIEGMRPGEILALRLGDFDVSARRIAVQRRVYRGNLDTPKTLRSLRAVAMSEGTAALVTTLTASLTARDPDSWLFPGQDPQQPLWRENVWRRSLEPVFTRLGLRWATFQVMRRTYATRSGEAGVDALTRAAQMGNTVDVNVNEYTLVGFADRLAAVRKLEAAFVG